MRELTPEEIKKRFGAKQPEPIAPIPAPVAPTITDNCAPPVTWQNDVMSAGVAEGPPAPAPEFGLWGLDDIVPREDNPRKRIDTKAAKFRELVESVRAMGIVTPLLARPHPSIPGKIELLAGHRRRMAAEELQLAVLPVNVRALDDRRATEIMVLENMEREDLTPLEEARGIRLLLESGHEISEVASRLGKSRGWIARRVQLLQLTKDWQKWAEEKGVSAAHLELIARWPKERQDQLYERLIEDGYDVAFDEMFMGPGSARRLQEEIADEMRALQLAPWELDNAVLDAKAGACAACPKRSSCQPDLFEEETAGGDRCLDPDCWDRKMKAFKERREVELQKQYPGLIKVAGKGGSTWDGETGRHITGCLSDYEYKRSTEKSKEAVPAFVVSGEGEGTVIWVKAETRGGTGTSAQKKVESAAAKQAAASQDPKACAALLEEKRKGLEQRRTAWVIQKLLELLDEAEMPAAPEFATPEGLVALVAGFGTGGRAYEKNVPREWDTQPKGIEQRQAVWQMVVPKIRETMFFRVTGDIGKKHHAGCQWLAHLLGAKLDVLKEESEKEIPEPKAWEQLKKLSEAPPAKKAKAAKGAKKQEQSCRVCGCTEGDCSQCVEVTGVPCHWVEPDLCSRCVEEAGWEKPTGIPGSIKKNKATGKKKGGKAA